MSKPLIQLPAELGAGRLLVLLAAGLAAVVLLIGINGTPTRVPAASCNDGFVIWSHGQTGMMMIDKSGSNIQINGKVHSNNDIMVSGSTNSFKGDVEAALGITINGSSNNFKGAIELGGTFKDEGASNTYPTPVTVAGILDKVPPVSYDIADYAPGGASADAAAGASTAALTAPADLGDYHVRGGSPYVLSPADAALGGLFYITGDININNQGIGPLGITIATVGVIDISGSNTGFNAFTDDLLLLSSRVDKTSTAIIKIAGSVSGYVGNIHGISGRVEFSGQNITYKTLALGQRVTLNGSDLTFNFNTSLCPDTQTPTITVTNTPTIKGTPIFQSTATPNPTIDKPAPTGTQKIAGGDPRIYFREFGNGSTCTFQIRLKGVFTNAGNFDWVYEVIAKNGSPGCGLSHLLLSLCQPEAFGAYVDASPLDAIELVKNDPRQYQPIWS